MFPEGLKCTSRRGFKSLPEGEGQLHGFFSFQRGKNLQKQRSSTGEDGF
jgi:hypothetical protein